VFVVVVVVVWRAHPFILAASLSSFQVSLFGISCPSFPYPPATPAIFTNENCAQNECVHWTLWWLLPSPLAPSLYPLLLTPLLILLLCRPFAVLHNTQYNSLLIVVLVYFFFSLSVSASLSLFLSLLLSSLLACCRHVALGYVILP